MTITEHISRWWQSKGFGIQSKSDYSYLHDVINERNPYYAYDDMQAAFPQATSAERHSAQLIYRIICNAQGKSIVIVGRLTPIEQLACQLSKAEPRIVDTLHNLHTADLLIVKNLSTDNSELWQQILQAKSVTFDISGETGICLLDKNRYPQHYRI